MFNHRKIHQKSSLNSPENTHWNRHDFHRKITSRLPEMGYGRRPMDVGLWVRRIATGPPRLGWVSQVSGLLEYGLRLVTGCRAISPEITPQATDRHASYSSGDNPWNPPEIGASGLSDLLRFYLPISRV
jgi:hypothetical protein